MPLIVKLVPSPKNASISGDTLSEKEKELLVPWRVLKNNLRNECGPCIFEEGYDIVLKLGHKIHATIHVEKLSLHTYFQEPDINDFNLALTPDEEDIISCWREFIEAVRPLEMQAVIGGMGIELISQD